MQACGDGDEVLMLIQRELVVQSQCQMYRFGFERLFIKGDSSFYLGRTKQAVGWVFKKKRVRLVESRDGVCDVQR